jgi:ABC-type iron transport system FetAB ATPase subunit
MNDTPLLSCCGLAVAPGGDVLLSGLDLQVNSGEVVGLRGPSGCGKTSLLRAVCGLDDPQAGRVTVEGRDGDETGWPCFRRAVSLVAQEPLLPAGTVGAALARPFAFRSCSELIFDPDQAHATLAEFFDVPPAFDKDTGILSVGERQRVALARSLLLDVRVLLLDEPTSALDPDSARRVETAVRARTEKGLAALVVSHDPVQAERWCDRVVDLAPYTGGGA